jgi:hypothetical protein
MGKYIVTDLTRFANKDIVCTAMIDLESGECMRPMPYLAYDVMKKYKITPGAIIAGDLARVSNPPNPHLEDSNYTKLNYEGPASGAEFLHVLQRSLTPDIATGFGYMFPKSQKFLPKGTHAPQSIITVELQPSNISVVSNKFEPSKLKLNIRDNAGFDVANMPITDLGFHEYAQEHHGRGALEVLNNHLAGSQRVLVRIGLGRIYCQPGTKNDGYWLQANGIYTFPSKLGVVRGYRE